MSDYGFPSLQPLLMWAVVALMCTLVLGVEIGALWRFRQHASLGIWLRVCAVASLFAALALILFAQRAWADYSPPIYARTYPPAGVEIRQRRLHEILVFYQTLGWVGVGVTIVLLALGALLVLASRKSRAEEWR